MANQTPRLLDLFCGAGGCAMGYHRAGFEVVGVDINPQPHYPFEFHQADALTYPLEGFDAIHASPPCQEYSSLRFMKTRQYAAVLAETRQRLIDSGLPWVIENVANAPMHQGVLICGTALGLNVRRHRLFDCSHLIYGPGMCRHDPDNINVYGHGAWNYRPRADNSKYRHWTRSNARQSPLPIATARQAFECEWMTQAELAECVPPAYTEWIGRQLRAILQRESEVA